MLTAVLLQTERKHTQTTTKRKQHKLMQNNYKQPQKINTDCFYKACFIDKRHNVHKEMAEKMQKDNKLINNNRKRHKTKQSTHVHTQRRAATTDNMAAWPVVILCIFQCGGTLTLLMRGGGPGGPRVCVVIHPCSDLLRFVLLHTSPSPGSTNHKLCCHDNASPLSAAAGRPHPPHLPPLQSDRQ